MAASLHKLTAGSGYDYLTRQVAAQDTTERGHATLASYYSEKGEVPGMWLGSGLAGLKDLAAGDRVTAEGRPFPVHAAATAFHKEVAIRCSQWQALNPTVTEVPVFVRAEIRNSIAREGFTRRLSRTPSQLELSSEVNRLSRDPSTACAGYDMTFTPVKSVSSLWAVAPPELAARIEQAHNAAVADALRFLEQRALYSREGAAGVRQVDVTGLVAAAFVHRDSRAGDPNLHTHVAIANKVQTLDEKWLAVDGRLIFKSKVTISETYNTQLESHLAGLGIRFAPRPGSDPAKREVREVVGVPSALNEQWSSRRTAILVRQAQLASAFQRDHHRPPTPVEALKLAQQATLETRDAKHEPRSVTQQRRTWWAEARAVLGEQGIAEMVATVTSQGRTPTTRVTEEWIDATAMEIVSTVEMARATWQIWHLRAEASRRARQHTLNPTTTEALTEELLRRALRTCEPVGNEGADGISEPAALRRRDGSSVYSLAGSQLYTSRRIVAAEQRIVALAGLSDGRRVEEMHVSLALLEATANGVTLNAGQTNLVCRMATSGARVQLALAPAGSGKTTTLSVLADAWREGGGDVLGLAPSAVAASLLRDQVGDPTTLAKLVWDLRHGRTNDIIGPATLVVIDEAGMADTVSLAHVVDHVVARGGSVRLIGDDQQLAAISAGGVLRDIAHSHGAVDLSELMRFADPAEAAASLALREGRPEALGFYLDDDRIHAGTLDSSTAAAFRAWAEDLAGGRDSLMLAGTREAVAELNRRARDQRLATSGRPGPAVVLGDGNHASAGDVIITRLNDRRLMISATDWVKNGDRWTVQEVKADGALLARHRSSGLRVLLPAGYVAEHVQLGYAVTVHSAQGITVDTTHGVLSGFESRQQLYVMMTRGRIANHAYVPVVGDGDEHTVLHPTTLRPETPADVLETILARDGAARSATTETREASTPATRLTDATARYLDALHLAAETILNPGVLQALDRGADEVVDGLTACAAWPTLRSALVLNAVDHRDPLKELRVAAAVGELYSAHDPAAVLTWRLPNPSGKGPLPWLPPVPDKLMGTTGWGTYLTDRASLVQECARALVDQPHTVGTPSWAMSGQHLSPALIREVEVWRASVGVDPSDRRPTGPVQLSNAVRTWQKRLESRLQPNVISPWADVLAAIRPRIHEDPFSVVLTHHLADLHASEADVPDLLARAAADGPLPAEHTAAALWWRLARQVNHDNHGGAVPPTPARPASLIDEAQVGADAEAVTQGRGAVSPLDKTVAHDSPREIDRQLATQERLEQRGNVKDPTETLIAAHEAESRRVHELNRRAERVRRPPQQGPSR